MTQWLLIMTQWLLIRTQWLLIRTQWRWRTVAADPIVPGGRKSEGVVHRTQIGRSEEMTLMATSCGSASETPWSP